MTNLTVAGAVHHPSETLVYWAPWAFVRDWRGVIASLKNVSHQKDQNHRTISRFFVCVRLSTFN